MSYNEKGRFLWVFFLLLLMGCGKNQSPSKHDMSDTILMQDPQSIDSVITITQEQFKTQVTDYTSEEYHFLGSMPVVVDFYATWCGPCRQLSPVLDDLASEYQGKVRFYRIDIDQNSELSEVVGIQSVPTLVFFPSDGGKPGTTVGVLPKEALENVIENFLKVKRN